MILLITIVGFFYYSLASEFIKDSSPLKILYPSNALPVSAFLGSDYREYKHILVVKLCSVKPINRKVLSSKAHQVGTISNHRITIY